MTFWLEGETTGTYEFSMLLSTEESTSTFYCSISVFLYLQLGVKHGFLSLLRHSLSLYLRLSISKNVTLISFDFSLSLINAI